MALFTVSDSIAYHLIDLDSLQIIKKAIWPPAHRSSLPHDLTHLSLFVDSITSLDFNPEGDLIATVDWDGVLLLSEINTNKFLFHLKLGKRGSVCNKLFPKHS